MSLPPLQSRLPRKSGDALDQSLDQFQQTLARDPAGHEREWAGAMGEALERVTRALRQHLATAAGPQGLYAEVDSARPELTKQTDDLGHEQGEHLRQIRALREEIHRIAEDSPLAISTSDLGAIRALGEQLLAGINQTQQAETSLVLESVNTDIGGSG